MKSTTTNRAGFTLVEMLVSVALVLMMMSLFAAIFQMAGASVSTQRGIAENDQRTRSIQTIIKADLDKRSFRNVVPFFAGEPDESPIRPENRSGYFYLSMNNLDDGTDDVLQFTIQTGVTIKNKDLTAIYGRAKQLLPTTFSIPPDSDTSTAINEDLVNALAADLANHPNQPEADDGEVFSNSTARSSGAEVCYFLRGGNLYRRVVLIRDPLPLAGEELEPQPIRLSGPSNPFDLDSDLSTDGYIVEENELLFVTNDFWRDFDFSAYNIGAGVVFHSNATTNDKKSSLVNATSDTPVDALGKPHFRFGFDPFSGQSREHASLTSGAAGAFMGRWLHEETSHPDFNYPAAQFSSDDPSAASTNLPASQPIIMVAGLWPNDPVTTTLVTELKFVRCHCRRFHHDLHQGQRLFFFQMDSNGGPRRSEDLLLTNVHEFRVELYDDRLQSFVHQSGH